MEPMVIVTFAVALLLNAGTPGPSIAALVSRVITHGWRDVFPFVLAMWIGEVGWLTVSMAGLTALAQTFHYGFVILKWAGIAYLVYLAWRMWRAKVDGHATALPQGQSGLSMFAAGMALTIGNPKIMVFYLAVLPSLVTLGTDGDHLLRGVDGRGLLVDHFCQLRPQAPAHPTGDATRQPDRRHRDGRRGGGDRHPLRDSHLWHSASIRRFRATVAPEFAGSSHRYLATSKDARCHEDRCQFIQFFPEFREWGDGYPRCHRLGCGL